MAGWWFRSINTTAWSQDELFSRQNASRVHELCRLIAGLNVSHIAFSQPMYLQSDWELTPSQQAPPPGWTQLWVDAIRATGKSAYWRGSFVTFKGWYGTPKLTARTSPVRPAVTPGGWQAVVSGQDKVSYVALAYQYILEHPTWFRDGDIWGVFAECEFDGVGNSPTDQFRNNDEFNQFLQDLTLASRAAFKKIGKRVFVGMNATDQLASYGSNTAYVTPETAKVLGLISIDRYEQSPEFLVPVIEALHSTLNVPIVSSEWGAIARGAQPVTNDTINTVFSALEKIPYFQGMGYWEAVDPYNNNTVFDPKTLAPLPQAALIKEWYGKMMPKSGLLLPAALLGAAYLLIRGFRR